MSDIVNSILQDALQKSLTSNILHSPSPSIQSPAARTYETLGKYINDFEIELDADHEIGARFVSFGQSVIFHIESIDYHGPDIITFYGINDAMQKVQLIQHISQLSVLLVAVKKLEDKPRRMGFLWNKDEKNSDS